MGILSWIVLGLIAGVLAGYVMKSNYGVVGDIVVGIVGALLGGWLYSQFGGHDVTGFNLPSIFIAFIGGCVLLGLLRLVTGKKVLP